MKFYCRECNKVVNASEYFGMLIGRPCPHCQAKMKAAHTNKEVDEFEKTLTPAPEIAAQSKPTTTDTTVCKHQFADDNLDTKCSLCGCTVNESKMMNQALAEVQREIMSGGKSEIEDMKILKAQVRVHSFGAHLQFVLSDYKEGEYGRYLTLAPFEILKLVNDMVENNPTGCSKSYSGSDTPYVPLEIDSEGAYLPYPEGKWYFIKYWSSTKTQA